MSKDLEPKYNKVQLAECWREAQNAMAANGGGKTMTQPFERLVKALEEDPKYKKLKPVPPKEKWHDCKIKQPKFGGEYIVTWNLGDGQYPTTTVMEWDGVNKYWYDEKGGGFSKNITKEILYWQNLPKPLKGIKKSVYKVK